MRISILYIIPSDATNVKDIKYYLHILSILLNVAANGQLQAKRLGNATIFIRVFDENNNEYSAELMFMLLKTIAMKKTRTMINTK